jgi:hypothetical protein
MPASDSYIGLIDMVRSEPHPKLPAGARLNSEHRRLLSRCHQPVTVVDLAWDANLPVGVVRVLLSDLARWGVVRVLPGSRRPATDERLLRDVLNGLQAL